MSERIALAALSMLLSLPALAQDPAQYQKLAEAMEKAEREAVRPGDEKLDCPALERQLVAEVTAPSFQAFIARSGRQAEQDMARTRVDPAKMTAQAAVTAFAALAPGGGWMGLAAATGQAAGAQVQATQNIQQRMQQANEMVQILPQLMRGQRVIELAQARKCDWAPAEGMKP
jgi:hypothetical protein